MSTSTSVFRSLASRPTFLRGTDDVPPFAPAFRAANAELAPFRGTLWDLESALLDVMADYPRLQASGLPVDTFLAQQKESRRPESDFLLRTVAQPGGAPQIGSLLRRYGEMAKLTFPDITPADLLQRAAEASDDVREPLTSPRDDTNWSSPVGTKDDFAAKFMPFTAQILRDFRETNQRLGGSERAHWRLAGESLASRLSSNVAVAMPFSRRQEELGIAKTTDIPAGDPWASAGYASPGSADQSTGSTYGAGDGPPIFNPERDAVEFGRARQREHMQQLIGAYYSTLAEYAYEQGDKKAGRDALLRLQNLLKWTPGAIVADLLAGLGAGPAGAIERGMPRAGVGLMSTIEGEVIEAGVLSRIRSAFARNGGVINQGDEIDKYLNLRGAEGVTFNAFEVLLRSAPGRSAVFEELIHTAQHRTGRYAAWVEKYGNIGAEFMAEIEAAKKLIRFQDALGLSRAEMAATTTRLEQYLEKAKAMGILQMP